MTMRFGTDLAKNMETSLNEMAPNIIRSAKEGSKKKLYANLIGPAEEITEGNNTIYFSPSNLSVPYGAQEVTCVKNKTTIIHGDGFAICPLSL